MDLHTVIAAGLGEKLKCFSCHNFLSYFPISTCSNNQNLCGRCEAPDGVICFEDEAFEALSQCLQFPCRYKSEGCCEEFLPKDIPQHEEACQYRVVPCIVKNPTQCPWTGSLPLLSSHCQEKHSDLIVKNGKFELTLSVSEESEHLMECDGHFLTFNRKFDSKSKLLRATLDYHEYKSLFESRTFQLQIRIGKTTVLSDFDSTNFNNFMFVKEKKSLISNNNSKVLGQILIPKTESVLVQTESNLFFEETNQELLSLLKCVECSKITKPPISRCVKNTTAMCEPCINLHIPKCVLCRNRNTDEISNSNPELDKIAEMVLYPCLYQTLGCPVKLEWEEISTHNGHCNYRNNTCCLVGPSHSCKWSGMKMGMIEHVLTGHQDIIRNSPFEAILHTELTCNIVKFSDCLFRVAYKYRENDASYAWSVQTIGNYMEEFIYELEIVDTDYEQKLLRRQKCPRLTDESDIFAETGKYCYFKEEQLFDFYISIYGDVEFKITIFKI